MELYKSKAFTQESLSNVGMNFGEIFQEIPIIVRNSHLVNAFLLDWESKELRKGEASGDNNYRDFSRLELSLSSFLQKNVEFMMEYIEDWQQDQSRLALFHKQRQRTMVRRKNEKRAGEEDEGALEEPVSFRTTAPPSRLESLLIANQINQYSDQINQFAAQSFTKLFLFDGLVNKSKPSTNDERKQF